MIKVIIVLNNISLKSNKTVINNSEFLKKMWIEVAGKKILKDCLVLENIQINTDSSDIKISIREIAEYKFSF